MNKPVINKPVFQLMPNARKSINNNNCPNCGIEILECEFKDAASKREYSISGMCQYCQDKIFGEEE
jgi:DNA-directed RNA polymerase subunit RPC12/RpoP